MAGEGRALFSFDPGYGRGGRYNNLVSTREQNREVFALAACPQLAENSRQGVPTSTQTLYRGFEFAISSTYMGLQFRCSETVSGPVVAPNKAEPVGPTENVHNVSPLTFLSRTFLPSCSGLDSNSKWLGRIAGASGLYALGSTGLAAVTGGTTLPAAGAATVTATVTGTASFLMDMQSWAGFCN